MALCIKIILTKTNPNFSLVFAKNNLFNYKFSALFFITFSLGIILLSKNPVSRYFVPSVILLCYYVSIVYSINKFSYFKEGERNLLFLKKANIIFPFFLISLVLSLLFRISLLANNQIRISRLNPPINNKVERIISGESVLCFYRFPTKKCAIAFALERNVELVGSEIFDGIKTIVGNQIRDFSSNKKFEYLSQEPTKNINKDIIVLRKKDIFPRELSKAIKSKELIYKNDKVKLYDVEYYLR